jgi:glycosyltransferase involved in cell wall biosynthesis
MRKVAIFHPTDPLGHVPGGIDTIIRGILKWAPNDLEYTLFGATSDETSRPVGQEICGLFGNSNARFVPLTTIDPSSRRALIPVTARYLAALGLHKLKGGCRHFGALDCHRMETLWMFRRDPRPKNITVHQDMSVIREPGCDIMWRHAPWLYERLESDVFHAADRIYTVRQTAVERYRRLYPDIAARIAFLPTWVDTTQFFPATDAAQRETARQDLRRKLGVHADSRVLVNVGRLDKQKDPLLLLNAFCGVREKLPNSHLVFIGDGVLRGAVERLIQERNIGKHVSLVGVMPPDRIAQIHRGSDLFVLSSAYEGMPIAVLEALGTGLPVVSTPVGEVGLVIDNGAAGRICSDFSAASLAQAVISALMDPTLGGGSCEAAVAPYHDRNILARIYDNHRRQVELASARSGS